MLPALSRGVLQCLLGVEVVLLTGAVSHNLWVFMFFWTCYSLSLWQWANQLTCALKNGMPIYLPYSAIYQCVRTALLTNGSSLCNKPILLASQTLGVIKVWSLSCCDALCFSYCSFLLFPESRYLLKASIWGCLTGNIVTVAFLFLSSVPQSWVGWD